MTESRSNILRPTVAARTFDLLRAALFGLVLTGCHSLSQPGSASFAAVVIPNRSSAAIKDMATQVFRENGYVGGITGPGQLVFEKEGTRGNDLAYNGVVGTHYGAKTIVRVRAEVVEVGSGSMRLQGQAFMVRNAGDSFFEDEIRLTGLRRGPYQRLLDEIAKRLK